MTIIRIEDCRNLGYCIKSVKPWFAENNLDFKDFVKNGISEELLIPFAKDNQFVRNIIEQAKKRVA
jgi:arsenate reductase-like glutaredoxin family protein